MIVSGRSLEYNVMGLPVGVTPATEVPAAVRLKRNPATPAITGAQYVFRQVVIRGNVVRYASDSIQPPNPPVALAFDLQSCENLVVEENVISALVSQPIIFSNCGSFKFFNNQAPNGTLVQGFNNDSQGSVNELATDLDFGLTLGF